MGWEKRAGDEAPEAQPCGLWFLLLRGGAAQPILSNGAWVGRIHRVHSPRSKVDSVVLVFREEIDALNGLAGGRHEQVHIIIIVVVGF